MSDFEQWWERKWRNTAPGGTYYATAKGVAGAAWNAAKQKAEGELAKVQGVLDRERKFGENFRERSQGYVRTIEAENARLTERVRVLEDAIDSLKSKPCGCKDVLEMAIEGGQRARDSLQEDRDG